MSKVQITQIKSAIGSNRSQRETLRSLGLRRCRHKVVHELKPEIAGMIKKVTHLISVESLD